MDLLKTTYDADIRSEQPEALFSLDYIIRARKLRETQDDQSAAPASETFLGARPLS